MRAASRDLGRSGVAGTADLYNNDILYTDLLVKGTARFCAEVADCDEEELNEFEADGKHLQFYAGAAL